MSLDLGQNHNNLWVGVVSPARERCTTHCVHSNWGYGPTNHKPWTPSPKAPAVLLLDELTSFLDARDQASVLAAVRAAVDAGGVTAVWVRSTNPEP
jgi:hypothetical protein